jgi:SpoVK/Ycf46/Vps4 family AAA+-type ATPase
MYVGQSEANIRKALETAEIVAPCVLWLEEIDKAFAGNRGSLDSGVGARVFGSLLTWMQEKTAPVFVYATCNDVKSLPPELLRKGRFDELFSVMLPTKEERKEIFKIHITKRGRGAMVEGEIPKLNLELLAKSTNGFSGSEIEESVIEALYIAFESDRDLNMVDLNQAITESRPLSRTMKEQFEELAQWCNTRTRPANAPEAAASVKESSRAMDA